MLPNVLFKTLRDQRRSLPFWGVGLVLLAAFLAGLYTPPSGTTTYFSRWWRPTLTS